MNLDHAGRDQTRRVDRERLVGGADRVERGQRTKPEPGLAVRRLQVGEEPVVCELEAVAAAFDDHATSTSASASCP